MKKELNKKGQELSIGTLILIVLGVIVLVLLILGFTLGWSNLWEKIGIFGGTSSLSDVATSCKLAVTSQSEYDYCNNFRKIKTDSQTEYLNCQDSRILNSLGGETLQCTKSEKDNAQEKCSTIKIGTTNDPNAIVNSHPCEYWASQ